MQGLHIKIDVYNNKYLNKRENNEKIENSG